MKSRSIRLVVLALYAIAFCLACIPAAAQSYLDNERVWSNTDPNTNVRRSDHFRIIWGNGQNPATSWEYSSVTEEMAQCNLQAFEHAWHVLHDTPTAGCGIHIPNQSANPLYQDGNFYRTNLQMFNTGIDAGGGTGTIDAFGFPWFGVNPQGLRYDPGPDASLHEYIHCILINAGGFNNTPYDGYWHESTDGWIGVQSYWYAGMDGYGVFHNLLLPHGRSQYDSWLLPQYMYENPTYGVSFMNTLWEQAHGSTSEYMFDAMVRLHPAGEPDPYNAIKDCLGKMAARNATWDYLGKQYYRSTTSYVLDGSPFNFKIRRGTTELVPQPGASGWYRVPFDHAPCQGGYNLCPINLVGKNGAGAYAVGVNFQPLWDSNRKSDWRACFVAVNGAGDARYSNIWNSGINTITLSADENILYLVVSATPDFLPFNPIVNSPSMAADPVAYPQAYRVQFVGTSAVPYLVSRTMTSGGAPHSNGGGWVSNSASVDATAYVGPNAIVGDSAQVRGYARIEDYAQIMTTAQVRDNAVVSGHAVIKDRAQVYGNAKVRDWATVDVDAQIYENARVIEHGYVGGHCKYFGNAVIKGCAQDYDLDAVNIPNVSGCAIKEGDCTNYASMTKGVLLGCVYGADTARINALADNNYMYCQYNFDTVSPNYALDKYGLVYGYLLGGPSFVDGSGTNRGSVLSLDGTDDYVELPYGVSDFKDYSVAAWVKWTGSANDQRIFSFGNGSTKYMYLTPKDAATGNLRLVITNGVTTQYLDGTAPIAANTWTHVAITFSGNTGVLYVNGTAVDTDAAITLNPDDCNGANIAAAGNVNFIGRGNSGNYFTGQLDDFRAYFKALNTTEITALQTVAGGTITTTTDTTAPTPNAATWLASPTAVSTDAVVMSATKGTDASNYVQYYFTCTAGGGHDSGWMSTNRYYDSALTRGATYTYTVKMRDKAGNVTTTSSPANVTLPNDTAAPTPATATFVLAPKGLSATSIKMTATPGADASSIEYKFSRTSPTTADSGWQASNIWTDTGLTSGITYSYTVQMRDAYANTGTVSSVLTAVARDDTAPTRYTRGEWSTLPYATIDNCIAMRARSVTAGEILSCNIANETVQYYFHCFSGGGPDSGWISTNVWKSSALADGTYSYQFKIKDALGNETPYSSVETGTVSPKTGYHSYTFAQLTSMPDDNLATFNAVVVQSNFDNYIVKDTASNATIKVMPAVFGPTDSTKVFKNVRVDGHLRTLSGSRFVSFATVTVTGDATTYVVSGKVTGSGGAGVSGATVYFSATPNAKTNPTRTATTNASGDYTMSLPNGVWYVAAEATGYYLSSDQTVTVNGAAMSDINIALTPAYTITASAGSGGTISPSGATLVASGSTQAFAITPSGGYSIGNVLIDGTNVGSVSSYTFNNVIANHTITVTFNANTRSIPRTTDLLFSCVTDTFPASGNTGAWASYLPAGQSFAVKFSPTVEEINGVKWEKNISTDKDGYDIGTFASSIAVNGVSAVVAVKPTRVGTDTNWQSVVDIFYDRFVLGVMNGTGKVCVRRNSTTTTKSTLTIPNGQTTVLSLVVQPDGKYKVWANGTLFLDITTLSTMTSLVPNVPGPYANHMNIGRNNPDDWSTYNGNIGDVFVYKVALSDTERLQLEADLTAKFGGAATHTITASAGTGGAISPSGVLTLAHGGSANFVITPDTGFVIADVLVDGVSQGAISSYEFTDLAANHTISASFTTVSYTITASAGTGGSIDPSGVSTLAYGSNTNFAITPDAGYSISDVLVDGVSQGAISSYDFNNLNANHTISASFAAITYTITASAGTGGSVTPSGASIYAYNGNANYVITPNTGYSISDVIVDGVSQGAVSSYNFNNITADHTISATFAVITYTITASTGANGSISPLGAVSVNYGANQTFYMTPAANYKITNVLVDGASVGALSDYTFFNVIANHTISVTFEPDVLTPLVALDVASLPTGTLTTWTNTGSYGGSFDKNNSTPTVGTVGGKKCVTFDGNDRMVSNFSAPSGITGVCDFTIAYWVYNPSFSSDECVLCWSRRSGANGTAAAFNFGSGNTNGAVVHTGTAYDMGFSGTPTASAWHHVCITYDGTTELVYLDGTLRTTEAKTLGIYSNYLLYIGCGYTNTGTYIPTRYYSGSLGTVRIYDEPLTATQVTSIYNQAW